MYLFNQETYPFATGQVFNSNIGEIIPAVKLEEHRHPVHNSAGYTFNGFNYKDR